MTDQDLLDMALKIQCESTDSLKRSVRLMREMLETQHNTMMMLDENYMAKQRISEREDDVESERVRAETEARKLAGCLIFSSCFRDPGPKKKWDNSHPPPLPLREPPYKHLLEPLPEWNPVTLDDHLRVQAQLLALVDEYTIVLEQRTATMGQQVAISAEVTTELLDTSAELKRRLRSTANYVAGLW
jgi:hypothetical protein